jgi:hypothetical protein
MMVCYVISRDTADDVVLCFVQGMAHAVNGKLNLRLRVPTRAMVSCYPGDAQSES